MVTADIRKLARVAPLAPVLAIATGAALAAAPQAPFHVRDAMQHEVAPAIATIWEIGNAAMNEEGGLDPALLDDASWPALAGAAARLEASGRAMAGAAALSAASPANSTTGEFEVPMATVQRSLDADPAAFRRMAAAFADYSARLEAAATARDVAATGELVAGMDAQCAACHAQFWYAE